MIENLQIRKFSRGNLKAIHLFFNRERNKRKSLSFFKKKYSEVWSKQPLLGCLAFVSNKLVGQCVTTLYLLSNKTTQYTVAQCGDFVVSKQYQGMGIGRLLIKNLELLSKNRNIDALISFPNKNAEKIFRERNWEQIGNFYRYIFPVKSLPFMKICNYFHIQWIYFYFLKKNITSINFNTQTQNDFIGVEMTNDYLEYKRYGHYSCLKYDDKVVLWSLSDGMSVLYSEVKTQDELLRETEILYRFCQKRGIHMFSYYCFTNSKLNILLKTIKDGIEGLPAYCYLINENLDSSKLCFNSFDRNAFDI